MKFQLNALLLAAAIVLQSCTTRDSAPVPASGMREVQAPRSDLISPANKSQATRSRRALERLDYQDGARVASVFVDTAEVADFAPSESTKGALLSADAGASEDARSTQRVRLWKVDERLDARSFARGLNEAHHGARFSPIFRESADPASPRRALPGGVIARFAAEWSHERVELFLQERGLAIERQLTVGANAYLVATAPGFAALDVARDLTATGQLVSATPNWWRESSAR
jgi:hypothetical protein